MFTKGKHERKACDLTCITESNTINYSQWCSHPPRNADLSCTTVIGGYCIIMPILVVIILFCPPADNASLSRAGSPWRFGSVEVLACVDFCWLLASSSPEGFISQEHSQGIGSNNQSIKTINTSIQTPL